MQLTDIDILRCPACYGTLEARDTVERSGRLYNGCLSCRRCGARYPVREGLALLAVINENWGMILRELIARREITEQELGVMQLEPERRERKQCQDSECGVVREEMFEAALSHFDFSSTPRVLEIGAGECKIAEELAVRGGRVWASDTEISNLRYLRFSAFHDDPPHAFEAAGQTFFRNSPVPMRAFFNTIVCDARRLPFADGVFDAATCRAMLHHVQQPRYAVREMLRVTKPGGLLNIIAEPARSILDTPEQHMADAVNKEEGLNEQAPSLLHYLRGNWIAMKDVAVQYWRHPVHGRTADFFEKLNYDNEKHYRDGETVRGWRLAKMLLRGAGVNIYARRNSRRIPAPGDFPPASQPFTISDIADAYFDFENEETIDGFVEDTRLLKKKRLDLLNHFALAPPSALRISEPANPCLESGWHDPRLVRGETARHLMNHATALIGSAKADSLVLAITASAAGLAGEVAGTVWVDAEQVGELRRAGDRPETTAYACRNPQRRTCHLLEIRMVSMGIGKNSKAQGKSLGPAVTAVRLE